MTLSKSKHIRKIGRSSFSILESDLLYNSRSGALKTKICRLEFTCDFQGHTETGVSPFCRSFAVAQHITHNVAR